MTCDAYVYLHITADGIFFVFASGQAAVITPRQVTSGLGARRVKAVAAAKHHTVVTTEGGEVFTWGSNRGEPYGMGKVYFYYPLRL